MGSMKAIVYEKYGPPGVLQFRDVDKPVPGDSEVLIKINAVTVASEDCTFRRGRPLIARAATGLTKPRTAILGTNLAGEVAAVGKDVKQFSVGDAVFAASDDDFGACAEYICLPEAGALAVKPSNLGYAEAASVCGGGLTALPFLRDAGKIQRGQKVLVNGASGSVGTAAVQLARHFGAEVTGVCSGANRELVMSLGAARVIDYTAEDFTRSAETYDIVFDAVGKSTFTNCKGLLKPGGCYLSTVLTAGILLQMLWTSLVGSKRAMIMFAGLRPAGEKARDLVFLKELAEAGAFKPVIDRSYPLAQIVEAHRYVDAGHKKGNVVVTMGQTDIS